jgi:hypothetical protein
VTTLKRIASLSLPSAGIRGFPPGLAGAGMLVNPNAENSTAKGSEVTGGGIQSTNDDASGQAPRYSPGGKRAVVSTRRSHAMATTERCPPKKPTYALGHQQYGNTSDDAARPSETLYKSPISSRIDCLVSASRSGKRLASNAPSGASFKLNDSDIGNAPTEKSEASLVKLGPCA